MILKPLGISLILSIVVAMLVARLFRNSIHSILERTVGEPLCSAWLCNVMVAMVVVGVSSGVRP